MPSASASKKSSTAGGTNNDLMSKRGICYLTGAGPGDTGLVTLRAKECIEIADVIAYDYLVNKEVLGWARPDAEIIYVGKQADQHTLPQESINALLIEKVKAGKIVTRLKGGDPYVFGRGGEEAEEARGRTLRRWPGWGAA